MERSTNDNFEQFLQENAEQFRMYPSDKVWEGISQNINKRKKRYFFFGLATLLTVTSSLGYFILNAPSPNHLKNIASNKTSPTSNEKVKKDNFNSITDSFERSKLITETEKLPVQKAKAAKVISIKSATNKVASDRTIVESTASNGERETWAANSVSLEK